MVSFFWNRTKEKNWGRGWEEKKRTKRSNLSFFQTYDNYNKKYYHFCNLCNNTNLININYYRVYKIFVVFFSQPQESEVAWGEKGEKRMKQSITFSNFDLWKWNIIIFCIILYLNRQLYNNSYFLSELVLLLR